MPVMHAGMSPVQGGRSGVPAPCSKPSSLLTDFYNITFFKSQNVQNSTCSSTKIKLPVIKLKRTPDIIYTDRLAEGSGSQCFSASAEQWRFSVDIQALLLQSGA